MKFSSLALWSLAAAFAFVVYAAFGPSSGSSSSGGQAVSTDLGAAMTTGRPVLLQFTASWCGPCRRVKPEVAALADELRGKAEVVAIDVDAQRAVAADYRVQSIPCFVALKDGREVARRSGVISRDEMRGLLGL